MAVRGHRGDRPRLFLRVGARHLEGRGEDDLGARPGSGRHRAEGVGRQGLHGAGSTGGRRRDRSPRLHLQRDAGTDRGAELGPGAGPHRAREARRGADSRAGGVQQGARGLLLLGLARSACTAAACQRFHRAAGEDSRAGLGSRPTTLPSVDCGQRRQDGRADRLSPGLFANGPDRDAPFARRSRRNRTGRSTGSDAGRSGDAVLPPRGVRCRSSPAGRTIPRSRSDE